jgi:uncharacterized protein DUF4012
MGSELTVQKDRVRVKERIRIRRRRRKGPRVAFGAAVIILLAGLLALGYFPARSARNHLLEAKQQMERGGAALSEGRLAEAVRRFTLARSSSVEASSAAHNPLLRIAGWLPIMGRTPDAITALADGGELVATASVDLAEAVNGLPGGLTALTPHSGGLPLEPMTQLAPSVDRASLLVHAAHLDLLQTQGGMLPAIVADARLQGLRQLSSLDRTLSTAAVLTKRLPAFFGANRPMRYFFGAQTPAELRGTGGFVGAYSTLTIHRGRLHFSSFRTIGDLPSYSTKEIRPPSADYARNYNQFGGAGFWQNINMTPDFPSAARAMLNLYQKGTGASLDGVVIADPFALKSLLEVTGPVMVPRYRVSVNPENVVPFTANRAYEVFKDKATRQLVLGEVAKTVFSEFMRRPGAPGRALRPLIEPISAGHLLVYSKDAALEKAFIGSRAGAALTGGPGELLSVVQNNGAGTKIDFYQDRKVNYSVRLGAEGIALGTATVQLTNNAPKSGVSSYIIGPFQNVAPAGENVAFVSLYCGSSCELRDFLRNNRKQLVVAGTERGYRFYQDYLRIPSHRTAELQFGLANPKAWEGNHAGGVYRLTFLNQATIRPTKFRIQVRVPQGMKISFTNVPMKVSGGTAVWEGIPQSRLEFEVRFQPPLLTRIWRSITDFLSRPVF